MARNAPRWLTLKSESLEDFVRFAFWTGLRVLVLIYVARWALGADVGQPAWRWFSLP